MRVQERIKLIRIVNEQIRIRKESNTIHSTEISKINNREINEHKLFKITRRKTTNDRNLYTPSIINLTVSGLSSTMES